MKISLLSLLLCAAPLFALRYPGDYVAPSPGIFSSDRFSLLRTTHQAWSGQSSFRGESLVVLERDASHRPLRVGLRVDSDDTIADSASYRFEWAGDIPASWDAMFPNTPSRFVLCRFRRGQFVDSTVQTWHWSAQGQVTVMDNADSGCSFGDSLYLDSRRRVVREVACNLVKAYAVPAVASPSQPAAGRAALSDTTYSNATTEYMATFRAEEDSLPQSELLRQQYQPGAAWYTESQMTYYGPANHPDSSNGTQGGCRYGYDESGRLILREGVSDTGWYSYDLQGRLVRTAERHDTTWYSYDTPLSGLSRRTSVASGLGVTRTVDGIHLELGTESLRSLELRDLRGRLLASFPALAGAQGYVELKAKLPVGAVLVRVRTDRTDVTRALTSP